MPYRSSVSIAVNGQQHSLEVDHRTTLLEVLRDHLDLTGAKRACDRGECGACTVLLDGQPVYACHLLAMQVRGRSVVTIEGLAEQADFRPLLEAFVAMMLGSAASVHPVLLWQRMRRCSAIPRPVRCSCAGNWWGTSAAATPTTRLWRRCRR